MGSPIKTLLRPAKELYNLPGIKPLVAPAWRGLYNAYHGRPVCHADSSSMRRFAPPLPDDPRYFVITSCGQNGSLWLGKMLHRHPDILCSCGYDAPPQSLNYGDNKRELDIINSVYRTPADFKYGSDMFAFHTEHYGKVAPRTPRQYRYFFEELEALPRLKNHKIIGNIHSMHASEVAAAAREGPNAMGGRYKHTTFIDLIRHPLMRLDSLIHNIAIGNSVNKVSLAEHNKQLLALEREQGADFSDPLQCAYFQAEYVQKSSSGWADDATVLPNYPRLIFERLRKDPDYFGWLISYISGGKVTAGKDYLDSIFSPENLETGRLTGRSQRSETPRDAYATWPRWMQADFARTCDRLDLRERYRPYGYDLSFVK